MCGNVVHQTGLIEDARIVLGGSIWASEMCNEAIAHDDALVFHSVVFLVVSIHKLLEKSQSACFRIVQSKNPHMVGAPNAWSVE
jgi:hypothetical protein